MLRAHAYRGSGIERMNGTFAVELRMLNGVVPACETELRPLSGGKSFALHAQ